MGQLLGCVGVLGLELHMGDEGLEGGWITSLASDIDVRLSMETNC